jgi:hypothetical protein
MTRKYKYKTRKHKTQKKNKSKGGKSRQIKVRERIYPDPLSSKKDNTDGIYTLSLEQIDPNSSANVSRLLRETDMVLANIFNDNGEKKQATYEKDTVYTKNPIDDRIKARLTEIETLANDTSILTDIEKRSTLTRKINIMKNILTSRMNNVDDELKIKIRELLDIFE